MLVAPLPMDDNQILRAAKEMVAEHGDEAIRQTDQRIRLCMSGGFYSVAKSWQLIREVIRDMQESDAEECQAFEAEG
jgi:hypothetical protein